MKTKIQIQIQFKCNVKNSFALFHNMNYHNITHKIYSLKYMINVTYNYNFSWGILIGALGFIPSVIFLIGDFIFAKLATFEVNGESITFYRGLLHNNIYVNGELKDSLTLFGYYLEAPLLDGSKVNVALGKWSVHITFSNGHNPIDL